MSKINGDKGRYDRKRKSLMHQREKMRAMRKELHTAAAKPSSKTKAS